MIPRDSLNFTYNGRHCTAFGCVFADVDQSTLPSRTIAKTTVPGRHGTLKEEGRTFEERPISGRLYFIEENLSFPEQQERVRRIAHWLSKPGRLVFDYEPSLHYEAEIESDLPFDRKWELGSIPLTFICQPFAMSDARSQLIATSIPYSMRLNVGGTYETPFILTIQNTSNINMSNVTISRKAEI